MSARRSVLLVAMFAAMGGLAYGGWQLWRSLSYRSALTEIRGQIEAGRHALAARNLGTVLAHDPGSDEAAYLLGLCERKLGRHEPAMKAWARIPPSSRFGVLALVGRAAILVDQGRFADAEDLIDQALRDRRLSGFDLRRFLTPLLWHEGRLEEARRLVEANWNSLDRASAGGSSQAIELVRLHILLSLGTTPIAKVQSFLERAASLAPDDDRVWLGRANLAIRVREFDEAARWLDSCLRRRPRDVPVWHARLEWAVATGRVELARECAAHVPADDCTAGEIDKIEAWLAEKRGDVPAERRALENLLAVNPAAGAAHKRLAVLAERANLAKQAAELRQRKVESDQASARYQELFTRDQVLRDAAEMARLAERLGRDFEAKAFWTVAAAAEPGRADLRKALAAQRGRDSRTADPGKTMAQVIASRLDDAASTSPP